MTGNDPAAASFTRTEPDEHQSVAFDPRSMMAYLRGQMLAAVSLVLHAWDRFWFRPADPYPSAVLRLLAGGMLFYSHLVWGIDLQAFFGSAGWNNAGIVQALQSDSYAWSFWWYVPDSWLMPVHVLGCAILLMFFLGLFTRVTAILSWLIAISYAHRAMLANYGLDQIVCVLVLYLCLSPCDQYLSLDAWRRRWFRGKPNQIAPSIMANLSCRLIQVHLCVMYLFAGLSKLQGQSWWNGNAVWETLANQEYQSTDMTWLAAFPLITTIATHMTVAWEVSFSALVWNRYLRPFVLLIGISMHLGIGMFLGMWTFGLAMAFGYVTFVPSQHLRMLIHGLLRIPAASVPLATSLPVSSDRETSDRSSVETGPPQGSGLPSEVALIVVSKSMANGLKVLRYLDRYGQRVCLVDGMIQARQLSESSQRSVIVCLDPHFNEEERQHWVGYVGRVNPQARFVFACKQVAVPYTRGKVRMMRFVFTLRDVREAIESITAQTMSRIDAPPSEALPPAGSDEEEPPEQGNSGGVETTKLANDEELQTQDVALYELTAETAVSQGTASAPRVPR